LKNSAALQDLKNVKVNTPAQAKRYEPKFRLLVTKHD
jgi:hypothetical protein